MKLLSDAQKQKQEQKQEQKLSNVNFQFLTFGKRKG
jgi:hypothetical protein